MGQAKRDDLVFVLLTSPHHVSESKPLNLSRLAKFLPREIQLDEQFVQQLRGDWVCHKKPPSNLTLPSIRTFMGFSIAG
jgi:hypothetical protein